MAKSDEPITIKKYANRRLYNTGTSTYVTLEDLAAMVKNGEDFVVYDAKTGEDITRSVLAQIIFEQENKEGQNLLPITFLRQLIRFYGDSMQMLVPRYLEVSIEFAHPRAGEIPRADGAGLRRRRRSRSLEDQVRRNMEMFERAFAMFTPFARREAAAATADARQAGKDAGEAARSTSSSARWKRCSARSIGCRTRTRRRRPLAGCDFSERLRSQGRSAVRGRSARPAGSRSPSLRASPRPLRPAPIRRRSRARAACARSISVRTKARSSSERMMFCTKAPSILTMSTPSLRRLRNEV